MSLTGISFNFLSFLLLTTEDFILITIFCFCLFRFKMFPVAVLYCWYSSPSSSFFDTCLCLLLLVKTLRLLDVLRLVTVCGKISISLGNISFHWNKFCSNLWLFHSLIYVSIRVYAFFPVLRLYGFSCNIAFLCLFIVSFCVLLSISFVSCLSYFVNMCLHVVLFL